MMQAFARFKWRDTSLIPIWDFYTGSDELIAASDIEGQRTWLRILARINTLERMEPDAGGMVQ